MTWNCYLEILIFIQMTPRSLVLAPTSLLGIIFKCRNAYRLRLRCFQYLNFNSFKTKLTVSSFPNPLFLPVKISLVCYFSHRLTLAPSYFHLLSISENSSYFYLLCPTCISKPSENWQYPLSCSSPTVLIHFPSCLLLLCTCHFSAQNPSRDPTVPKKARCQYEPRLLHALGPTF